MLLFRSVVLTLYCAWKSLKGLKIQIVIQLAWVLRFCVCNKFLGDAAVVCHTLNSKGLEQVCGDIPSLNS